MGNKRAFNRDVVNANAQVKEHQKQLGELKKLLEDYRAVVHSSVTAALLALNDGALDVARIHLEELQRSTKGTK